MNNSVSAFIFSVIIALLALGYASSVYTYNKDFIRNRSRIEKSLSNIEIINSVKDVCDSESDLSTDKFKERIEALNTSEIEVKIEDISSKIDINFIDFTLFKDPAFKALLKPEYEWSDLEDFRNDTGFVTDPYIYRNFFLEDIDFNSLFSCYSIPNLNSSSDIMLKNMYEIITDNKSNSSLFKDKIDGLRIRREEITERNFNTYFSSYDKEFLGRVSYSSGWNINYISEGLLKPIFKKYKQSPYSIINIRDKRYILEKDIDNLIKRTEKNKSLFYYLTDRTYFWLVSIKDIKASVVTTFILKWNEEDRKYKIISFKKEIL